VDGSLAILAPENIVMPETDFAWADVPDLPDILKKLRKHGPAVTIKYWDKPTWLILDHADVDRCFHDQVNFNIAEGHTLLVEPVMGHNIQCMAGDEHRQHRGLINPLFFPKSIRSYVEPLMEPIAHELLDRIEGQREVDFVPAFAQPFPFLVITRLLGIPVEDEAEMMKLAVKILDFAWHYEEGVAARDAMDGYSLEGYHQESAPCSPR
jgi:cytochrome P450